MVSEQARAFQGESAEVWVHRTSKVLIKDHDEIERKLRSEQRLEAFRQKMRVWCRDFLGESNFQLEPTASALYEICEGYGLLALIEQSSSVGEVRVRGAKRSLSAPAAPGVEEQLREVARLFAGG